MAETKNNVKLTVIPEELVAVSAIINQCGISTTNTSEDNGNTVIEMALTDEEYNKLNGAISRYQLKTSISRFIDTSANAVINTAEYLATDVVVPVAKVGVKLGAGVARVAAESAVIAGSSVVNVATEQGKATVESIKKSQEFQQAKTNFNRLTNFLGFGGSRISITKA